MIKNICERFREVSRKDIFDKQDYILLRDANKIVQEVAKEYAEKKLYSINLEGCDDETIFDIELTLQEYSLLKRISKLANETSTYGCMPRMYVTEIAPYQKGE